MDYYSENTKQYLQASGFIEPNKNDKITDWSQLQKPDMQPSGIGASIGRFLKSTGIGALQNVGQSLVDAAPKKEVGLLPLKQRDVIANYNNLSNQLRGVVMNSKAADAINKRNAELYEKHTANADPQEVADMTRIALGMGIYSGNSDDLNNAYGRADILIEDNSTDQWNTYGAEHPAHEYLADRIINGGEDYDKVRAELDDWESTATQYIREETKHEGYEFLRNGDPSPIETVVKGHYNMMFDMAYDEHPDNPAAFMEMPGDDFDEIPVVEHDGNKMIETWFWDAEKTMPRERTQSIDGNPTFNEMWHFNGVKASECTFDGQGNLQSSASWDDFGDMTSEITYKNGEPDKVWSAFDDEPQPEMESEAPRFG